MGEMPWSATGLTCTADYADTTPPTPPTGNCHDEASCNAVETCHVEFRNPVGTQVDKAAICDFPNIRRGCCDYFNAHVFCASNSSNTDCFRSTMSGFGHGEWQWWLSQHDSDRRTPTAICPDVGDVFRHYRSRMIQHCRDLDGNVLAITTTTTSTPAPPSGNCHDEASCAANETCQVQVGPMSCEFPNTCTGVCDEFRLMGYCRGTLGCRYEYECDECEDRAAQAGSTPGEVQWRQARRSQAPIDWCPGLRSMMGSQQAMMSYCQVPPGTASALQWEDFAIMAAQKPQPELRRNQSLLFAVVTLAIAATLMISIIAIKKRRKPEDMYTPLVEGAA